MKHLFIIMALLCLLATAACADVDFGSYARSIGMGGAGLALVDEPVAATTINPAAMAMLSRKTHFIFPSMALRSNGASVNDIIDNLSETYDVSGDDAVNLARDFGKGDTELSMDMVTGFTFGPIGVTADAQALAQIQPSEQFKQWAETDALPTDPSQFYADVTGQAVAALPSVAMGMKVPGNAEKGELWVGTRLKMLRGYAHRERVQLPAGYTPGDPVELQSTVIADTEDSGLGADLGMIYKPVGKGNLTYAVAITNALKPNLGAIDLDSVINLGVAGQPIKGFTWAVDLANLTGAYDSKAQLRLGAEYRLGKVFAVRGGYSSRAFTFGLGVFGIDFAYSGKAPFTVGRTVIF